MTTVDVVLEDARWTDLDRYAQIAVPAALEGADLGAGWEVVVLGCDDARIADLNGTFRGKTDATNVLSWPSAERGTQTPGAAPQPPDPSVPELGDLALAYETCAAEAQAQGKPFADHVTHLLVHGTLHLLGYDHETEADAMRMESLERQILSGLGLPDPYDNPTFTEAG